VYYLFLEYKTEFIKSQVYTINLVTILLILCFLIKYTLTPSNAES